MTQVMIWTSPTNLPMHLYCYYPQGHAVVCLDRWHDIYIGYGGGDRTGRTDILGIEMEWRCFIPRLDNDECVSDIHRRYKDAVGRLQSALQSRMGPDNETRTDEYFIGADYCGLKHRVKQHTLLFLTIFHIVLLNW